MIEVSAAAQTATKRMQSYSPGPDRICALQTRRIVIEIDRPGTYVDLQYITGSGTVRSMTSGQ
jgi:uncharacterized protein YfaP (DUF2135 family)